MVHLFFSTLVLSHLSSFVPRHFSSLALSHFGTFAP
nr:MAG TPA: hypothetical protein [Caudoviricetes sp.]